MLLSLNKQPDMLRIRSYLLGNACEDIGRSYWSTFLGVMLQMSLEEGQ